jgi:hypothetical protein
MMGVAIAAKRNRVHYPIGLPMLAARCDLRGHPTHSAPALLHGESAAIHYL